MNASMDDLEEVFQLNGDDDLQPLQPAHVQHTWNSDVPPSSSLEPSAFDDPLSFLKVPEAETLPEDDGDFPALCSVASSSQQQHGNVSVPPPAATASTALVPLHTTVVSTGAHEADEPIAMAFPISTDGVNDNFLNNPWANPEYQPLIQWVLAAANTELVKPFEATVPAHLKPASWKGFRADDTECGVNLGKDLGRETEERLVLDAKNLFMYIHGKQKKWFFMCPNCKRIGHSKSGKDTGDEQFMSLPRSYPDRQYLYICTSCNYAHQNFRPNRLMELGMQKADELGMDIFEYFLGDYDHVVDQIKKNFSNLDEMEYDRYTPKVTQTKRENLEPFMGCRLLSPDKKKEKTNSAVSPTLSSSGARSSSSTFLFPMPSGGNLSLPLSTSRPQKRSNPDVTKMPRKTKTRIQGSEVQVTMDKTQAIYPELEFWNILNEEFKSYIDSGTLTKEVFDNMIICRNGICKFMHRCVPYSSQKGDRFSVQDGEMNNYDYVVRSCNKAIARVFCDNALVSQELKDDCMDALGFGDEEIAAILSKPLPDAQPADRSEQILKIVPASGDKLDTLRRAGLQLASPTTAGAFTPSPTAGPSTFVPRNKSPLSGFATTFTPVRDETLALAPHMDLQQAGISCICAAPPPESDKTIQCSLCKQWSHRVCYSIDTMDDIKDWCCMHCKPAVYQSIAMPGWTVCPLAGLKNQLPCMCNNHYPLPFAAVGTDIDYDDTNWVQCSVGTCGRLMHSKCYHPFECGKVHVLCPTCQEEDDEDDM